MTPAKKTKTKTAAEQFAEVKSAPLADDVPLFVEQPAAKKTAAKKTATKTAPKKAAKKTAEPTPEPEKPAPTGQKIGYVRVSSTDQNTARQLAEVSGITKVFTDKLSGKDTKRPQLQEMLEYVREGDTVYVHSLDRLGRNLLDLRTITNQLTDKGVNVHFLKENLVFNADKTSSMSQLLFNIMGAFAEFERSLILERQKEGIKQAKLEGKYKGRKAKLSAAQVAEIKKRVQDGENRTELAREYGVSRMSIYNVLKDTE